jgi:FkbM family methyltransferase
MTVWSKFDLEFECRDDTTDWNTVNAAVGEDEYGLSDVDMRALLVFDVGSHIGSIGIWCAARGAQAVCIEPIPENLEMIELNARRNGLSASVYPVKAAAGAEWSTVEILYGYESNETERAHAYIGNIGGVAGGDSGHAPSKTARVPGVSLREMMQEYGIPDIVKLDCEGGEWHWLGEPEITQVPLIVGEWHPVDGWTRDDVVAALGITHALTFSGPDAGPGGFRAELR